MNRSNKRPPFAAMASDAKRFLGLRLDIRELINQSRPPSDGKFTSKSLRHPVLAQLYQELLSNNKRGNS